MSVKVDWRAELTAAEAVALAIREANVERLMAELRAERSHIYVIRDRATKRATYKLSKTTK